MLPLMLAAATIGAALQPDPAVQVLKRLVFNWCVDEIAVGPVPRDVAARLTELRARCDAFVKEVPEPRADSLEGMVASARRGYQARLFAIARGDARTARAIAADYVEALRPCYEWEGFHDCPEREARFAEQYLSAHPDSPLSQYLPLLAAHRWICAAEAYDYEQRSRVAASRDGVGVVRARRAYAVNLRLALRSRDPLVRFAAEALRGGGACFGGG